MSSTLVALVLLGCDITELQDTAETLFQPEEQTLDAPGRRVLPGTFVDFQPALSGDVGIGLLALAREGDRYRLHITSSSRLTSDDTTGELSCDAGLVVEARAELIRGDKFMALIVRNLDQDGWADLEFLGANCEELAPPQMGVHLATFDAHPRFWEDPVRNLVIRNGWIKWSRDGNLSLLTNELTEQPLGTEVTYVTVRRSSCCVDALLSLEGGEQVYREYISLEEFERYGSGITAWYPGTGEPYPNEATLTENGLSFQSLSIQSSGNFTLGSDACLAQGASHALPETAIPYRAPCDSPSLRLALDLPLGQWLLEVPNLAGEVVSLWREADPHTDHVHVYLIVAPPGAPLEGDLYHIDAGPPPLTPVTSAEAEGKQLADFPHQTVTPLLLASNAKLDKVGLRTNYNGVAGDLVSVTYGVDGQATLQTRFPMVVEATQEVRDEAWFWVITGRHEEGNVERHVIPEASLLNGTWSDSATLLLPELAWTSVSDETPHADPHLNQVRLDVGLVLLSARRGSVSTLSRAPDETTPPEDNQGLPFTTLSTDVRVGTLSPMKSVDNGLLYLTGAPDDSLDAPGTLEAYLPDVRERMRIHDGVTRYVEGVSPRGVFYLVTEGELPGIWFAKAR